MRMLADLITNLTAQSIPEIEITGLCMDSRCCLQRHCFLAIQGEQAHGLDYLTSINPAVVLTEVSRSWNEQSIQALKTEVPYPIIIIKNLSALISQIASAFYQHPSQKMQIIGITGTNGKSSISSYIAQALGQGSAMFGTLGVGRYGHLMETGMTTPDPLTSQSLLASLVKQNIKQVAFEVSSHALVQNRVAAVNFEIAIFTNLTRDHLDYHGDMETYAKAKKGLFNYPNLKWAVVNVDDEVGLDILNQLHPNIKAISYSLSDKNKAPSFIFAKEIKRHERQQAIYFESSWGHGCVNSHLISDFNASNLLATLAILLINQIPLPEAINKLEKLVTVAGRMQYFGGEHQKPLVVVDYAHTPEALKQVLLSLRNYCKGRLYCIFGCGGERDTGKRPLMGEVAFAIADEVYLTDDNPRTENSKQIIEGILKGMPNKCHVTIEPNRAVAIRQAIDEATPNDLVLIAGKGHENIQLIGNLEIPFSDVEQVKQALAGENND